MRERENIMAGNKRETIPEICEGCTQYWGEGRRCSVQKEPGWLWENGGCWSKRTDPAVDKRIYEDIQRDKGRWIKNEH